MAIKSFSIDNFRTFGANGKPAEFELSPITILTGTNSSGKSSFIKALKFITNALSDDLSKDILLDNNDCWLSRGFNNFKENTLNFGLNIESDESPKNNTITFKYRVDKFNRDHLKISEISIFFDKNNWRDFNFRIYYSQTDDIVSVQLVNIEKMIFDEFESFFWEPWGFEINKYYEELNKIGFLKYHDHPLLSSDEEITFKEELEALVMHYKFPGFNKTFEFNRNKIKNFDDLFEKIIQDICNQVIQDLNTYLDKYFPKINALITENVELFLIGKQIMINKIDEFFIQEVKDSFKLGYYILINNEDSAFFGFTISSVLDNLYHLTAFRGLPSSHYSLDKENLSIQNDTIKDYQLMMKLLKDFIDISQDFVECFDLNDKKNYKKIKLFDIYRSNYDPLFKADFSWNINNENEKKIALEKIKIFDLIKFFEYWVHEFNIADRVHFVTDEDNLILKVKVEINGMEKLLNLNDIGFGASQILPIITKVVSTAVGSYDFWEGLELIQVKNKYISKVERSFNANQTILIEEPESHLHPALQSKLADFFLEANKKFGINFILETHSEYLIRKLQYLIATKQMKKEDIAIYYFGNDPSDANYITKMDIDDYGYIKNDFGEGFFDESARLITNLWEANREN